jgi:predicted dehydrogenase
MKTIPVAVIGYGYLGKWHAQKVDQCQGAKLVAIVEPGAAAQAEAKRNHPQVKVVASINEVMTEVEAVIVVTPTSTHFEVVKDLISKKKHIFCEKPLCATWEEAKSIVKLAQANPDLKIQVGHSERFHPLMDILKEKVSSLSTPFSLEFIRVTSPKGRALDVHVTDDIMIHDIDLLLHVLGQKPISQFPVGFKLHSTKLDFVDVTVLLQGGSKARLKSCREEVEEMRMIHLYGQTGHFKFDLMNYEWTALENGSPLTQKVAKRDHLLEEQKSFYQAIINNSVVCVTPQEATSNIEFLNQVHTNLGL